MLAKLEILPNFQGENLNNDLKSPPRYTTKTPNVRWYSYLLKGYVH